LGAVEVMRMHEGINMDQNYLSGFSGQDDVKRFISFCENYFFFRSHFLFQMYSTPFMIFLLLLITRRELYFLVSLHLCTCFLIAFALGGIATKKKIVYVSQHFERYKRFSEIQEEILKLKSFKDIFLKNWPLHLKYLGYREYLDWTPRQRIISLVFLFFYSVPVFLPFVLFFRTFAKPYFILYPFLLLYATYSSYWLGGYLFWKRRLKPRLERSGFSVLEE
jgi:hypothetical protein